MKYNTLHIGVLGGGEASVKALSAISELDKILVEGISCSKEEREKIAYPDLKIMTWQEILASDKIHAVYIAVPNAFHIRYAREALAKEKHVLIEKPLAANFKEAEKFVSELKPTLVCGVAFKKRFSPGINKIKEIVDRQLMIDTPIKIRYKWHIPKPQKSWIFDPQISGGGVLMDLGSHIIDLFEYVGGTINLFQVKEMRFFSSGIDHLGSILVGFNVSNRMIGEIDVKWLSDPTIPQIQRIELVLNNDNNQAISMEKARTLDRRVDILTMPDRQKVLLDPNSEYHGLFDSFVNEINMGTKSNSMLPTIEEGVRNLKLIQNVTTTRFTNLYRA